MVEEIYDVGEICISIIRDKSTNIVLMVAIVGNMHTHFLNILSPIFLLIGDRT
jgi:hypothetical protein